MSDTLPNIDLPSGQWVNIYTASGILTGTAIAVENVGDDDVYLVVSALEPTDDNIYHIITPDSEVLQNQPGDSGAWAKCPHSDGKLNVFKVSEPGFAPASSSPVILGRGITLDAWGTQKMSLPLSLFHGLFTYDIPQSMWLLYENGAEVGASAQIQSIGGVANIATTATITNAVLESREAPRYQPNRGHLFSMAGWFPNKTNDGQRDFGLFTRENGVFFRLKSDGLLYAVLRSNNIETKEELIDTGPLTGFDVEKNNIYDIQYQWRSAGNYMFYIGDPASGVSKLVHVIKNLGVMQAASMENPALPICFEASRNTQDVEMNIACADITSENGRTDTERFSSAYAEDVAVNGANEPVLIVSQPLLVGGKTNTRGVTLARISVKCDKKAVFKVWITRDPTAITGATFQPVNSGSFVESDSPDMDATAVRATSVNIASMQFVDAIPVEASRLQQVDNPYRGRIEFPVVRGDYLVITVTSTNSIATAVIEWGEQI